MDRDTTGNAPTVGFTWFQRSRLCKRITRLTLALAMVVALASPALINAQAMSSVEPFKVGTFEIGGAPTVGVVLRDALVIDLAAANTALEIDPMYAHVNAPADMIELIGQYEYGLKYRIYEIVNNVVGNDQLGADYVHRVEDLDILPPIMYPSKIMKRCSQLLLARVRRLHPGGAGGEDPAAAGESGGAVPVPQADPRRGNWQRR